MCYQQQTHRTFIAIFPPKEIIDKLLFIQSTLKSFGGHVRWEREDKFHFTLQFWGNQTEEWLKKVNAEIQSYCFQIPKFKISITKVGCFPNRYSLLRGRRPKIFWIGSDANENPQLIELVNKIQSIAKQNGLEPEKKPFHPHITIGRGKARLTDTVGQGKINSELVEQLNTVKFHPIEFECKELCIIKSQLASTGSTYTRIFTFRMRD